jgi:hypothetical protein
VGYGNPGFGQRCNATRNGSRQLHGEVSNPTRFVCARLNQWIFVWSGVGGQRGGQDVLEATWSSGRSTNHQYRSVPSVSAWAQSDSNTQLSDLESYALPLRHGPVPFWN